MSSDDIYVATGRNYELYKEFMKQIARISSADIAVEDDAACWTLGKRADAASRKPKQHLSFLKRFGLRWGKMLAHHVIFEVSIIANLGFSLFLSVSRHFSTPRDPRVL